LGAGNGVLQAENIFIDSVNTAATNHRFNIEIKVC
jgi:hypothetical protein